MQNKLKLLFEKLLEPNYVLNSYYADGLINKLTNASTDPEISFLGSLPFLTNLLLEAINKSENAHVSAKVFLTRVLGIVCKTELNFTKFNCPQGDIILQELKRINSPNINPSLRVAFTEVALAIVNHSSGVSWLLETGVWKEILSLVNEKTTIFVIRQAYKFAAEFVWKLNDLRDVNSIKEVISYIIRPVSEEDYMGMKVLTSDDVEEKCKSLEPMANMLIAIISKDNRLEQPTLLLSMIVKEFKISHYLYVVIDRIHHDETSLLLSKVIFWVAIVKIFLEKPAKPGVEYVREDFRDLGIVFFNAVQFFMSRRNASCVISFSAFCTVIWKIVFGDKTVEKYGKEHGTRQINLRSQSLFMCIVPILVFIKLGKPPSEATRENINDYIVTLLNSSCESTARISFALRDLILELDTMPLIVQSVKKLTCLKHRLNDEQANLVFQALFYALRDYDPIDDFGDVKPDYSSVENQDNVFVMTYVLDIVLFLVKNHNINWHESIEVLCLYSVVYNILKKPNLTVKFVVTALNVITVTIKKFLPPNLSLLLESKPGSTMHELGKLIYMKLHDLHWEVRDSALELLHVITEISFIKFPPFQKQIIQDKLINVAATVAFNDYEAYVQVSALKCIGAASKVNAIWELLTAEFPTIQEQTVSILRNNPEGIVRKEACNVLCDLYQNLKISPNFKQVIYEHMVSSAICDFHWEVQLSALRFWKIVLESLLTDQGMLDGVFPPVTFSRQSRKIVTLNETEIQRRLFQILNELSSKGCLTVLVKLLHDDTESEIMESALNICDELLEILNKHKVPESLNARPGDPQSIDELLSTIKEESDSNSNSEEMADVDTATASDRVIDGILKADDINLLANIYERHMSLQTEVQIPEKQLKPKIKLLQLVTPSLFVSYLKSKDFKQVIKEKRRWSEGIRSISSLLDDVLGMYDVDDEINSLDCY